MIMNMASLTEKVEKIVQPPGQPDLNIQAPIHNNKKYKHDDKNRRSVWNRESKAGQTMEDAQLNNISKASNRGKTVIPSKTISDLGPVNQRNSPVKMKVEEFKEEIWYDALNNIKPNEEITKEEVTKEEVNKLRKDAKNIPRGDVL